MGDLSRFDLPEKRIAKMKNLSLVMRCSVAFVFMNAIVSVITGCNDSPQTLALSGDIVGYSTLYDLNENPIANDTGITVSVEGENHTTTTDSMGQWDLAGLTTGIYNIDISKPGFGMRKILDFQFVGGGQANAGTVPLFQIPTYSVTKLSDTILLENNLVLSGTFSNPTPTNLVTAFAYVFFDTVSSVSSDPKNYLYALGPFSSPSDTTFSQNLPLSYLQKSGFQSGQTVYMVAYASSSNPVGYTDFASGNQVLTGLNPAASNVVSFIMP